MNIIEVKTLTKDYGNQKGIFDVSFEIGKGEVVGFLGPNGAGKTTTIRHLLGFIKNRQGTAYVNGFDSFKNQVDIQKIVGYLPGEINFIDDLRADGFLKFIAGLKGIKSLTYAEELLSRFDLDLKQSIKKMSKGMKQKLGIIIAFMGKPDVLILDEPSTGLDPLMQQVLVDLILEHKKLGATILISSHMFEEVEKTCDRIIMIKNGRIVADNNVLELKAKQVKKYLIEFSDIKERDKFVDTYQAKALADTKAEYILKIDFDELIKILAQFKINDFVKKELKLEEIFMQFYGDKHD